MVTKSDKRSRTKNEYKRLRSIFSTLPTNEVEFIDPLLQQAAFLCVTLEDLSAEINNSGTTDEYQNGANQRGQKISAKIQAFNQTAKVYHNLMLKLRDRLPREQRGSVLAEMMSDD